MSDEYKVCRWCKHYKDGCCTKGADIFSISVLDANYTIEEITHLEVKEPESFYCSNWEQEVNKYV